MRQKDKLNLYKKKKTFFFAPTTKCPRIFQTKKKSLRTKQQKKSVRRTKNVLSKKKNCSIKK